MNRRELLMRGALAGVAFASQRVFAQAAESRVIPWSDQPIAIPPPLQHVIKGLTRWEDLDSQITPNDKFFSIAHYNRRQIDPKTWRWTVADAMNPANILCYEMNGAPLPADRGFPCRLIAPGWFGVANVKWLTRIGC